MLTLALSSISMVDALVGVGVGLPSASRLYELVLGYLTLVPTKPRRFRPVLPRPSQFSFSSLPNSSILACASSLDCTPASTERHCSIRPTVSVTCDDDLSVGLAAGGDAKD